MKGFQSFDPSVRITGVILNNIKGGSHKAKAVAAIEHYCHVPVIGAIPRMEEMQLAMRHLGLVPYREGFRPGRLRCPHRNDYGNDRAVRGP